MISKRVRRVALVALTAFSGWSGEWSYIASWVRVIDDWVRVGYPSAYPRFIMPRIEVWQELIYGPFWRVAFLRGVDPIEVVTQAGFGFAVLALLVYLFYEFLKGRL